MHNQPEIIILGIDPGTRTTGYGIIQRKNGKILPLDFGCIRPPPAMKLSDRYFVIFSSIEELVCKYRPHAVAVETQYVSKNPQSAIKLGMARGAVVIASRKNQTPIFEYAPTKAKLAVTGNGSASKSRVQTMMMHILGLNRLPEPEDAADALALAVCHLHAIDYHQHFGNEL